MRKFTKQDYLDRCVKDPESDCIFWTGCKNLQGYGCVGKKLVHRYFWEQKFGKIPKGKFILHTCDKPACVNLKHLWIGTQVDNMRDCAAKKRTVYQRDPSKKPLGKKHGHATHPDNWPRGETHHTATITNEQAREVKMYLFQGCRVVDICKFTGISKSTVCNINNGRSWKHIKLEGVY
jgi:hypothetical protein